MNRCTLYAQFASDDIVKEQFDIKKGLPGAVPFKCHTAKRRLCAKRLERIEHEGARLLAKLISRRLRQNANKRLSATRAQQDAPALTQEVLGRLDGSENSLVVHGDLLICHANIGE